MIKAVIFDLDGVIVSTDEYHYQAWKMIADECGIYFDREINNRLRGVSRMASLEIILERSDREYTEEEKVQLAERKNNRYRELLNNLTPEDRDPAFDTFYAYLKEKGIRTAVGSSSKNTRTILEKIGLIDAFDAISDGTMITRSKPDPEVFLKAAELLGEEPQYCLVVEDAIAGVEAGKAAGMTTIGIKDACASEASDYPLSSLTEAVQVIEKLNGERNKMKYEKLLSPIKIRNTVFKNRIGASPTTPFFYTNEHTRPSEEYIEYVVSKARGGCGVITISDISTTPVEKNVEPVGHLDLFSYFSSRDIMRMIDRVHHYGCKLSAELMSMNFEYTVCGGDITGAAFMPNRPSKGMMTEEIMEEVIDEMCKACVQAKKLGFDMVMLHMGHGTIFSQFLSPFFNHRTDEYGGSLENRCRFPLKMLKAIREAVGRDFLIELRISGDEKREGGITIDQSVEFIKKAQEYIDIVNISTGGLALSDKELLYPSTQMPSDYMPEHCNAYNAKIMKNAEGIHCVVSHQGGLQDLDEAEWLLENDYMDLFYCGRGLMADPELGNKAYEERNDDVLPCIKCYHCVDTLGRINCSVNPLLGREIYALNLPAPKQLKKVAVVGGGPAGMRAAVIAAARGHDVTLFEKDDHLGGRIMFADKMDFKRGVKKYKNFLIHQLDKTGVKVHLNTEATPELLEQGGYEHVIIAIGADNNQPPIPGLKEYAHFASDLYEKDLEVGQTVAIIGGGLSGTETAIYLARKGHKVHLIEATGDLCGGMHFGTKSLEYYRCAVGNYQLEENAGNAKTYLNSKCVEIGKDYVKVEHDGEVETIQVDDTLVCIGLRARTDAALKLWKKDARNNLIGDCVRAEDIEACTRSAYDAAINIGV